MLRNASNHVVDVEPAWAWVITSHLGGNFKVATANTRILITKGELQCKGGLCQTCEALEVSICFGRLYIERFQRCPVYDPAKNISHIHVFVDYIFPTPPIKLKEGLQIGVKIPKT